jgi:hypothetical protein
MTVSSLFKVGEYDARFQQPIPILSSNKDKFIHSPPDFAIIRISEYNPGIMQNLIFTRCKGGCYAGLTEFET